MDLSFRGRALPLADIDLPRLGHRIGVGEDELHAFMDVEAAGKPFDAKGRPKMLFEPHRFYALLGKGAKRDRAVKEGLAYAKWGEKPYPRDSYPRLAKAMAIDETAALKAASWGLTQILGSNHKDAGFTTVQEMVTAFMDGAAAHLEATITLIIKWGIDDDLRDHNWTQIARVWNGPAHAKHNYAGRMKAAFAKWQKIRDTPFDPATDLDPASPALIVDEATVRRVQGQLYDLGYTEVGSFNPATGQYDGRIGTLTKTAILAFRLDNDLPLTATIDDELILALAKAKPRDLPRQDAEPAEVREKVPEVRANWLAKVGAWFVGIPAAIGAAVDGVLGNLGDAAGYIQPVKDMLWEVPGWVWLALIAAVALALYFNARRGEESGMIAFRSGERR